MPVALAVVVALLSLLGLAQVVVVVVQLPGMVRDRIAAQDRSLEWARRAADIRAKVAADAAAREAAAAALSERSGA